MTLYQVSEYLHKKVRILTKGDTFKTGIIVGVHMKKAIDDKRFPVVAIVSKDSYAYYLWIHDIKAITETGDSNGKE